MTKYCVSKRQLNGDQETVITVDDDVVARFFGAYGRVAYHMFTGGIQVAKGDTLFDLDSNQYLMGTLELLCENPDAAALICGNVTV